MTWTPSDGDRRLLWWTAGPAGELAVVSVAQSALEHTAYIKGWLGWGPAAVPFDAALLIRHPDGTEERRPLPGIPMRLSHVALLPDGDVLLVKGRTSNLAPNALVLGRDIGFCVGDDLDVLMTDRHGSIWIAYGDEGIYGGHPQSAGGFAGWTATGDVSWEPGQRLPGPPLSGSAGATEGDLVWFAWYSGRDGVFLSRITPATGDLASWKLPIDPDGVAVRGDRVVLTQRIHDTPRTEVVRGRLDGDVFVVTDRRHLDVPGPVVHRCGQGRDGILWLRAGDTWVSLEA